MNNDVENTALHLDYEIPTGVIEHGRPVILRSSLEGEQGIAAELQMHLEIQQELQQEIPLAKKPAPRKCAYLQPIRTLVSASKDLVTRDNISQHYPDMSEKVIRVWEALVGEGAARINHPYHQIITIEKRVMDVILENQQEFQFGLDWTSRGIEELLPEHFSLSRYSSKWFLFAHYKKNLFIEKCSSKDFVAKHQKKFFEEMQYMGLNHAIIVVRDTRDSKRESYAYFNFNCIEKTFEILTPEDISELPQFDAHAFIMTDSGCNYLYQNEFICVPSPNEPQQLALVWIDEPKLDSPLRIQFKASVEKPFEHLPYQKPELTDFSFLGHKAEQAYKWYLWHVDLLNQLKCSPAPLNQMEMSKRLFFLNQLNKLYNISPLRHLLFVEVFLSKNTDWEIFLSHNLTEKIDFLCKMSNNSFIWCDSLFRQHARWHNKVDFSEMMNAYLYFLKYLRNHELFDDLPDHCGISDIKHLKPALFRLMTLLSHADAPKRQLQYLDGLDFGPYGFYFVATDNHYYFEMLTGAMFLTPSGVSTNDDFQKLCYTLSADDMGKFASLNYASVSAIYYRLLNIYESPNYRRIFDYDLYSQLEQMVSECRIPDELKVYLLHYVYRHTRGVSTKKYQVYEEEPGSIQSAFVLTLKRFGLIPSEDIIPFQYLKLQDLRWMNAIQANYCNVDNMPSLLHMDKILCLAEAALFPDIGEELKKTIFVFLLSGVTLQQNGLDEDSLTLLFQRMESSSPGRKLCLYRASDKELGLFDVILGFFDDKVFKEHFSELPQDVFFNYTIHLGQLLMCVDLGEKTSFTREEISAFLQTLKPVTDQFGKFISVRYFINDLLHIFRTIHFSLSPLPTLQNIANIFSNKKFRKDNESNLQEILFKERPDLIFVQHGECDWQDFNLEKCKKNERILGIHSGLLSNAFRPEQSLSLVTLGQGIEAVQKLYPENSVIYRQFLDVIQKADLQIEAMLSNLINLIKYCHHGVDIQRGASQTAAPRSSQGDGENHLAIFPALCKLLIDTKNKDFYLRCIHHVFEKIQELQDLSKQQRAQLLINLCEFSVAQEEMIDLTALNILNRWANSSLATNFLNRFTSQNVSQMIGYIEKIHDYLTTYVYSKPELMRLWADLLDGSAQSLLERLLKATPSNEKMHLLCIYHAQYISFDKMDKLLQAFESTILDDKDWHGLFTMQPYPQYDFIFNILTHQDSADALRQIHDFHLEPNGISFDPSIFQITREEKNRLIRVFSQIYNKTQACRLSFEKQSRLLADYLQITLNEGPQLARLTKEKLKQEWNDSLRLNSKLKTFAIMREMYRRVTGHFPYCTQMLALQLLDEIPGHVTFEYETGQGKSIVMALASVYVQQFNSLSVYVASRNRDLGHQDYIGKQTREFIRALDIECPDALIEPGLENPCKAPGFYYFSSAGGISLTQSLQQFANHSDFFDANLILDEFDDTTLNDLTHMNVTISLPQLQEKARFKTWASRHICEFYQNLDRHSPLLENDRKLTVVIRDFLLGKARTEAYKTFVRKLSHQELLEAFLGADTARLFIEGKHFVLDETQEDECLAYPMRKGEPQKQSIFSEPWAHSALHAYQEKRLPGNKNFKILPETVTIGSATSKKIFDSVTSSKARIIGLTATAGVSEEVLELQQKYQMSVFQIPPYHVNQRVINPAILVSSAAEIPKRLHEMIQAKTDMGQKRLPIYIYCADGKIAKQYYEMLKIHHQNIQLINGQESEKQRAQRIQDADLDNMITVTTLLLLRGIDFQPSGTIGQQRGGYLIQTFLSHHRDTKQVQGRVARNGKLGTYQLLLDTSAIPFWQDVQASSEEERLERCRTLMNKAEAIQRHFIHAMDDVRQILLKAQDECFIKLEFSENDKTKFREILLNKLDELWNQKLKASDPHGDYVNHPFCRYHQGVFETQDLEIALEQFEKSAFDYWTPHAQEILDHAFCTLDIPSGEKLRDDLSQLKQKQKLQHYDERVSEVRERFQSLRLAMQIDETLWLNEQNISNPKDYLFGMYVSQFIEEYNQIVKDIPIEKGILSSFWAVKTPLLQASSNTKHDLEVFMNAMKQWNDKIDKYQFLPLILKLHFFKEKFSSKIEKNISADMDKLTKPVVEQVTIELKHALFDLSWHKNYYSFYYWLAIKAIRDIAKDLESQPIDSADDLKDLNEKLKCAQQTLQNMSFQWFLWGHHDTLVRVNGLLKHLEILRPYEEEIITPKIVG